ncbi:MotA/TolQ/ExbB proton channel family protein [Denitrificimonas caeni]|uniref:MotA/TolQ/ExbB proton channel family protein n=1 Tax=Denitrificimonas caeni TaxID=521720 RepID=UPI001964D1A7|nr:MotA/TolQ/ExbB proton channel family protein [Denitrificimonas caeni]
MKRLLWVTCAALFSLSVQANVLTPDQLLERIRSEKNTEEQLMQEREQRFLASRNQQAQLLADAKKALVQQESRAAALKSTFTANEQELADQEQLLKQQVGDLGELFAVVRQSAGDLAGQWRSSLLNVQFPQRVEQLDRLSKSRVLPSAAQVESFWLTVLEDMIATGRVERVAAPVIGADGQRQTQDVFRVGPFSAYSEQAFLTFSEGDNAYRALPKQPSAIGQVKQWIGSNDAVVMIPLDPTRGALIEQLQRQPSVLDRLKQGGLVGWVIVALGVFGFALAAWRLLGLMQVLGSVRAQMRNLSQPNSNNPLGRVLSVLGPNPQLSDLETLELKLDEAVMQEVPQLEKGQGLLKLLAAVAPLLGLLGTVTGMIITFQAITQSGGGDSRLMADGISQALVTTVEGLVVAIPLLFLHSILSARSKTVVQLLEQQCVGLLALHMTGSKRSE